MSESVDSLSEINAMLWKLEKNIDRCINTINNLQIFNEELEKAHIRSRVHLEGRIEVLNKTIEDLQEEINTLREDKISANTVNSLEGDAW